MGEQKMPVSPSMGIEMEGSGTHLFYRVYFHYIGFFCLYSQTNTLKVKAIACQRIYFHDNYKFDWCFEAELTLYTTQNKIPK
jgi:hypothetical protein